MAARFRRYLHLDAVVPKGARGHQIRGNGRLDRRKLRWPRSKCRALPPAVVQFAICPYPALFTAVTAISNGPYRTLLGLADPGYG